MLNCCDKESVTSYSKKYMSNPKHDFDLRLQTIRITLKCSNFGKSLKTLKKLYSKC